jgi:GTP pyrophosphokinase
MPRQEATIAARTSRTASKAITKRFADAVGYALRVHAGQRRKGTRIPYVSHPIAVASIALEHGASEDEAIAALLHDAIEDSRQPLRTKAEIRRRFGAVVAEIVEGCSDSETQPKPLWRARKDRYLAHLRKASPSIRLVSASDKLHNARAILGDYREVGEALWDRFTAKKDGTLWYYRALADTFRQTGPRRLARELDGVVTAIEGRAKRASA